MVMPYILHWTWVLGHECWETVRVDVTGGGGGVCTTGCVGYTIYQVCSQTHVIVVLISFYHIVTSQISVVGSNVFGHLNQ